MWKIPPFNAISPDPVSIVAPVLGSLVIVVIAVLVSSSWTLGLTFGSWWSYNWSTLVGILVFIGLIVLIVTASKQKSDYIAKNILAQDLRGVNRT